MQIDPNSVSQPRELIENARLIIASAFAVGFGLTLSGYSISLFAQPMMAEFNWSLSQYTGVLFALPIAAIFFPFVGRAMDRRGERPVVLTSIFLLAVGYVLLVLVQPDVWSFYALFTVAMVMGAGAGTIGYARAVTREVENAKGFALALMLSGASIAGMVSPPIIDFVIVSHGWRFGFLALAAACIFVAFPAAFLGLSTPKRVRERRGRDAQSNMIHDTAFLGVLSQPVFWVLAVSVFLIGSSVMGLAANAKTIFMSWGLSQGLSAAFVSLIALSVLLGRLVTGFLIDRHTPSRVAGVLIFMASLGGIVLAFPGEHIVVLALGTIMFGAAQGAELDLLAFFTNRYFGNADYGAIYGALSIAFIWSLPFGAIGFAQVFERSGSFDVAFAIAATALFTAAGLLLLLGRFDPAIGRTTADIESNASR